MFNKNWQTELHVGLRIPNLVKTSKQEMTDSKASIMQLKYANVICYRNIFPHDIIINENSQFPHFLREKFPIFKFLFFQKRQTPSMTL